MTSLSTKPTKPALLVLSSAVLLLFIGIAAFDSEAPQQKLTGHENHSVTLAQAVKFVQNFKTNPAAPSIKGGFIGRDALDSLLAQSGCIGVRYYYAKKDDGSPTLVLVGVGPDGNDLEQGVLLQQIIPCPPWCPSGGQLSQ